MKVIKNIFRLGTIFFVLLSFGTITNILADSEFNLFDSGLKTFAPPFQFGEITTGKNSRYNTAQNRQDLSGAATDGNYIIFTDDGGSPADFNFVRVTPNLPDSNGVNLPLSLTHQDMEAATFYKDFFVISGSLSDNNENANRLTRFKLNEDASQLVEETSVDLRDELLAALQAEFGDEWFNRIKDEPGRAGGLNIEGLSQSHTGQDVLLWGLRSPLFGDNFGNPSTNPDLSLSEGMAIIAAVKNPFSDNPSFSFETIHLDTEFGDQGIRGMEWIPALHSYVIIGGPIEAADNYSLWRLRQNGQLDRLDLPGFNQLCRPETLIQVSEDGKDFLVVLSEESGASCNSVDFTFIKAEIIPGNGGGNK
jgi:hypothetical protein